MPKRNRPAPTAASPVIPCKSRKMADGGSQPVVSKPVNVNDTNVSAAVAASNLEDPPSLLDALQELRKIKAAVTCTICLNVPFEPYMTQCGHTYCYACLSHWLESPPAGEENHKTCPACRTKLDHEPAPAYVVKEVIKVLQPHLPALLDDGTVDEDIEELANKEASLVEVDRCNEHPEKGGLFKGIFKKKPHQPVPMHDVADDVFRCRECGWELEEDDPGTCHHCGISYAEFFSRRSDGTVDWADRLSPEAADFALVGDYPGGDPYHPGRFSSPDHVNVTEEEVDEDETDDEPDTSLADFIVDGDENSGEIDDRDIEEIEGLAGEHVDDDDDYQEDYDYDSDQPDPYTSASEDVAASENVAQEALASEDGTSGDASSEATVSSPPLVVRAPHQPHRSRLPYSVHRPASSCRHSPMNGYYDISDDDDDDDDAPSTVPQDIPRVAPLWLRRRRRGAPIVLSSDEEE